MTKVKKFKKEKPVEKVDHESLFSLAHWINHVRLAALAQDYRFIPWKEREALPPIIKETVSGIEDVCRDKLNLQRNQDAAREAFWVAYTKVGGDRFEDDCTLGDNIKQFLERANKSKEGKFLLEMILEMALFP